MGCCFVAIQSVGLSSKTNQSSFRGGRLYYQNPRYWTNNSRCTKTQTYIQQTGYSVQLCNDITNKRKISSQEGVRILTNIYCNLPQLICTKPKLQWISGTRYKYKNKRIRHHTIFTMYTNRHSTQ